MINGIICINKEQNMTSHDVCCKVRKILGEKKIGHSGTLDPMATGVMGVLVGRSTKLSNYITSFEKEYIATMEFGKESDSFDIWTKITKYPLSDFSEEQFRQTLNAFIGEITQTPPIYSAIKVKGKPLYKYALEGKEVEIPKREVYIKNIELISINLPKEAKIKITCSKGTYIRSLISDIGKALGTRAVMSSLERTKNGILDIKDSVTLKQLEEKVNKDKLEDVLKPDDYFLRDLNRVDVNPLSSKIVLNGNALLRKNIISDVDNIQNDSICRLYLEDKFIGLGKKVDEGNILIRPVKILYGE